MDISALVQGIQQSTISIQVRLEHRQTDREISRWIEGQRVRETGTNEANVEIETEVYI